MDSANNSSDFLGPEPVTNIKCGPYGSHNIQYDWQHPFDADDGTYDNNTCFEVFYNGLSSKYDNVSKTLYL